ncbi:MAG TPA: Hsp70 family protein, partial [Polyangiaceae bacterium]|nr:Hsp70 family protein [Polyangiaceae bacterium]
MSARYTVGIDLGTTHCALAFADASTEGARPEALPIPQLIAQGQVEARPLLPSFLYLPHASEGPQALPWDPERSFAVGEHARARGADAPLRLVSSAKSWLCHTGIDRRSPALPVGAPEDIEKVSPVEAAWRYLEHMIEAWDARFAKENPELTLANQDIILAVPASFDAAARDLTVEAAYAAGLENLTLLEEPQAALYAWIDAAGQGWRKQIRPGEVILVVDVGGGTTDFSAIAAVEKDGALELVRVAVGDHILLGGDNMDLALAHVVRTKLAAEGKELDRWQMSALTFAARTAKERMLGDLSLASVPVVVPSRGSKLLGSALRAELTREDIDRTLVGGFFPEVAASARPASRPRAGLTQLGLPYAQDPAVTKHLAAFLGRQAGATARLRGEGEPASASAGNLLHPTAVLFNGGVMKSAALRERVMSTLNAWLEADGAPP